MTDLAAWLHGLGLAPVLVYLQRRSDVIRCLESEGYVEGWRAAY